MKVAYIKTDVAGVIHPAMELELNRFDYGICLAQLDRTKETLCEMDTLAHQELSHFEMITVELAQERPWTYERHQFIIARSRNG